MSRVYSIPYDVMQKAIRRYDSLVDKESSSIALSKLKEKDKEIAALREQVRVLRNDNEALRKELDYNRCLMRRRIKSDEDVDRISSKKKIRTKKI